MSYEKPKRVAIYFRYSRTKDEELDVQVSERRQKEQLEAEAIKKNWIIVFCDGDKAVKGDVEKPVLNKLRSKVEQKQLKVDIVFVDEWSRLTRKDSIEFASDIKWIRDAGATIAIKKGGMRVLDLNNNTDLLMLQMEVYVANQELKDKAHRIVSTQKQKVKAKTLGFGAAPFGFDRNSSVDNGGGPWVANEDKKLVQEIFKTYLDTGNISACVPILQSASKYDDGSKSASQKSVKYILRNPIYIGQRTWGVNGAGRHVQVRGEKTRQLTSTNRIDQAWYVADYTDVIEPFISYADFAKVQKMLDENKRNPSRIKIDRKYKYAGKVRCGCCGKAMSGETAYNKHVEDRVYYVCRFSKNKRFHCYPRKTIREDVLDYICGEYGEGVLKSRDFHESLFKNVFIHLKKRHEVGAIVDGDEYAKLEIMKKRLEEMKEVYTSGSGWVSAQDISKFHEKVAAEEERLLGLEKQTGNDLELEAFISDLMKPLPDEVGDDVFFWSYWQLLFKAVEGSILDGAELDNDVYQQNSSAFASAVIEVIYPDAIDEASYVMTMLEKMGGSIYVHFNTEDGKSTPNDYSFRFSVGHLDLRPKLVLHDPIMKTPQTPRKTEPKDEAA